MIHHRRVSDTTMSISNLTTLNSEDPDYFYSCLEGITDELRDDIEVLVTSCIETETNPGVVLASYVMKIAFEYASHEIHEILGIAVNSKNLSELISHLNKSLIHVKSMQQDEEAAIIDMIN